MSSIALSREIEKIEDGGLAAARAAFLSVDKGFTIRRGKVAGEAQFEERLRRAIAAYQAGTAV